MLGTHTTAESRLPGIALLLPANQEQATKRQLESEYRHIFGRLDRRGCADQLHQLPQAEFIVPSELAAELRADPGIRIVHFSGPSDESCALLGDELVRSFAELEPAEQVDCVILNARHSPAQATTIAAQVEWVVSMAERVAGPVATAFAGHFYVALSLGQSIESAFEAALDGTQLGFVAAGGRMPKLYRRPTPAVEDTLTDEAQDTAPDPDSDLPVRAPATTPAYGQLYRSDINGLLGPMPPPPVPISPDETDLLLSIIEEHAGISLSINSDRFLLRLSARLEALKLANYSEYCHYLYYNEDGLAEMEELIELITTHETYFFREQFQLDALSNELLPRLAKQLQWHRRLRIWSAGCSTGEEVYTLAILLHESGLFSGWDVSIVGTDISPKVITTARTGRYTENSFRTTSAQRRKTYFTEDGGPSLVREDIRAMCRFEPLNLLLTDDFAPLGTQDIIMCRNVLIYLSAQTRQDTVSSFYESLNPGGYLLLGHSESMLGIKTRFERLALRKNLVYQKPR